MPVVKILVLTSLLYCIGLVIAPLPGGLKACDRNLDPHEFDLCWVEFAYGFRKLLNQRIISLDLPKFDPLSFKKLDFVQEMPYLKIDGYLRDVYISGVSKYFIEYLHLDKDTLDFNMNLLLPDLNVSAWMISTNTLFNLKLPTLGHFNGTFKNTKARLVGKLTTYYDKHHTKRIKVDTMETFITLGDGPFDVELKNPTHLQWASKIVLFLYRNAKPLTLQILAPIINGVLNSHIKRITDQALQHLTYHDLAPNEYHKVELTSENPEDDRIIKLFVEAMTVPFKSVG